MQAEVFRRQAERNKSDYRNKNLLLRIVFYGTVLAVLAYFLCG